MSKKLKVVAVVGSLQRPSRTLSLTQSVAAKLGESIAIELEVIELGDIVGRLGPATRRTDLPAAIEQQLKAVESADLVIAATPVYRASFTGLFKHFFDFIDHTALVDVPVLLLATGGSQRHALVIEGALRPLFSFFQSLTLPIGVFATDPEFSNYQVSDLDLVARIDLAVERALPWLEARIHHPSRNPQALAA